MSFRNDIEAELCVTRRSHGKIRGRSLPGRSIYGRDELGCTVQRSDVCLEQGGQEEERTKSEKTQGQLTQGFVEFFIV